MEARESRLQVLSKFSPERRRDRYGIIFIWKLSNGLVSGFYDFEFHEDPRRGQMAVVKDVPVSISARDRDLSLAVKGAKMFNLLPRYLRDFKSDQVENFKFLLDKYLENIPDVPIQSSERRQRKMHSFDKENWQLESNSLIDKIPKQKSKEKKEILKRQDRIQPHN